MLQVSNIILRAWILEKKYKSYAEPKIQYFIQTYFGKQLMIIVKQGMWIIRFEHDNGSFQSNQSLLYEFNLRSLPLNQVQDVANIEFLTNKDI